MELPAKEFTEAPEMLSRWTLPFTVVELEHLAGVVCSHAVREYGARPDLVHSTCSEFVLWPNDLQ